MINKNRSQGTVSAASRGTQELLNYVTHPLDVFAEGLAEAGAEDLELNVRVGATVFKVHGPGQTRDVPLQEKSLGFWVRLCLQN